MDKQVLVTIPHTARYQLDLDQGNNIRYIEQELKFWKVFTMEVANKPMFPFGQRAPEYRVSSQGQVTVPKYVLDALNIKSKEELSIEYDEIDRKLTVVKSFQRQFEEILLSYRPNFYEDRNNELLTIVGRDEIGQGDDRLLFVDRYEFDKLKKLYLKLKQKYEPNTEKPWVGVPDLGDQGLSIFLNESNNPSQLTVTKLGDKYLSEPMVAKLWRERIPFFMDEKKIYFYIEGKKQEHDVTPRQAQEIMKIFQRNAKQIGSYKDAFDQLVETALFYTGDMAIFRSPKNTVEFLPKRS